MVKDKSSNSRIFDKDGFRKVEVHIFTHISLGRKRPPMRFSIIYLQRAACICVKNEDECQVNYLKNELDRKPKVGVKVRRKQTKINELTSKQQLLSKSVVLFIY